MTEEESLCRREEKRSVHWRAVKKTTDQMIKKSKLEYYEKMKSLAKKKNDMSLYYRAVASLKDAEDKTQCDVQSLFEGKSDVDIADCVAVF